MTVQNEILSPANRQVCVAESPRVFSRVGESDCVAAIWQRQPLPRFQNWIDGLAADQLPSARLILRAEFAREAIGHICSGVHISTAPECDLLCDDIAALVAIFASVAGTEFVRLRLGVGSSASANNITSESEGVRLVCSYRGSGTLFGLTNESASGRALQSVPTGSAILFRNGQSTKSASEMPRLSLPSLAHADEQSLLLTLDPVLEPKIVRKPGPKRIH